MGYISTPSVLHHGCFDAASAEVSGVFRSADEARDFCRRTGHQALPLRGEGPDPVVGDTLRLSREHRIAASLDHAWMAPMIVLRGEFKTSPALEIFEVDEQMYRLGFG